MSSLIEAELDSSLRNSYPISPCTDMKTEVMERVPKVTSQFARC